MIKLEPDQYHQWNEGDILLLRITGIDKSPNIGRWTWHTEELAYVPKEASNEPDHD